MKDPKELLVEAILQIYPDAEQGAAQAIVSWASEPEVAKLHTGNEAFGRLPSNVTDPEMVIERFEEFVLSLYPHFAIRSVEGEGLVRKICTDVLERALAGKLKPEDVESVAFFAKEAFEDHSRDEILFPFPSWISEMYYLAEGFTWPANEFDEDGRKHITKLLQELKSLPPAPTFPARK